MATSKTLTPTNVTIQIPEFTDQPDQRVNSNCIDKEADAINALNSKIGDLIKWKNVQYTITDTTFGFIDLGYKTSDWFIACAFTPSNANNNVRLSNLDSGGNWRAQIIACTDGSIQKSGTLYIAVCLISRTLVPLLT